MLNLKTQASALLESLIEGLNQEQIKSMLEYPPNSDMGDVALPCFKLSRTLRKNPKLIADELAEKLNETKNEVFSEIKGVSGYLNFYINKETFFNSIISEINEKNEEYSKTDIGKGETIVIDYSAPNIAKPFHIGHLRSTAIGAALYNIYKFLGYNVVGINHLGDWGTQFGKVITAYKKWGNKEEVEQQKVEALQDYYVRFHTEAENDPSLEDEAREWFAKMEQGDGETLELWKWMVDITMEELNKAYVRLDVSFDSYAGESFYNDKMDVVVEELKEKGLLTLSDGAQIVDLSDYDMPPCLILKTDGSTLYPTRDIAAAIYRVNEYNPSKIIYVTDYSQELHFRQWMKVFELIGRGKEGLLKHIPFGRVKTKGEGFASRKGNAPLLSDLLDRATEKTLSIINQKNPDLEDKELVAEQMGVGAIIFNDLYNNKIKDIFFSYEEMLNFDGETGPYVQYTHARCSSVINKSNTDNFNFDGSSLTHKNEYQLAKTLYVFGEKVVQAKNDLEPSVLSRYLVDLAQDFNRFYHDCPILSAEKGVKEARLALVKATQTVLKTGLSLIGLATPDKV